MDIIQIPFKCASEVLIDSAKKALEQNGGSLDGNNSSGTLFLEVALVGEFKGTYQVHGQLLTINITEKPFFVGAKMIEVQVKKFFDK